MEVNSKSIVQQQVIEKVDNSRGRNKGKER